MTTVFNLQLKIRLIFFQCAEYRFVSNLDAAFFAAFAIDENDSVKQVYVFGMQRAKFGYSHATCKQQLDHSSIAQRTSFLMSGLGIFLTGVNGGQQSFNRMQGNGFRQSDRFAKVDFYTCVRFLFNQIFIFQKMKEGF